MAYETTKVAPEKSQADLKRLLKKHGADAFQFSEGVREDGTRGIELLFRREGIFVKIRLSLKTDKEQEERRAWRVLFYGVKSKMEYLEEGVETFEQSFLAHIVNPSSGMTIYEELQNTGRLALPETMLAIEGAEA